MQQHLPDDLWIDIFSFLPLADLCAPCFTSTTLRDAVCHLIHSRLPYPTYWWRHRKQLPVHNMEIAEWWLSNVREPTKLEVLAAARIDQLELIDLFGWDDTHLSLDIKIWQDLDSNVQSMAQGSKRIITACHKRGHLIHQNRSLLHIPVGERPLDMVRWIFELPVEGLPSVDDFFNIMDTARVCFDLASSGQKDTIMMLKQQGYQGAGEAGSIDMIRWLEDNEISHFSQNLSLDKCVGSMDTFRWGLEVKYQQQLSIFHSISTFFKFRNGNTESYMKQSFVLAVQRWVMDYCFNKFGLPPSRVYLEITPDTTFEVLQSAINHKYFTRDTRFPSGLDITVHYLPIIQWMHERQVLHPDLSVNDVATVIELFQLLIRGYGGWTRDSTVIDRTTYLCFTAYDKSDEQVYNVLVNCGVDLNLEALEWLLQRRWKKSEAEVQKWFDREIEDITKEWLEHLNLPSCSYAQMLNYMRDLMRGTEDLSIYEKIVGLDFRSMEWRFMIPTHRSVCTVLHF
ncbi:hypothetical protein PROFUN_11930 [Planoprotostelium fungivorum]|uniref:F-box domain-containing protein n=1 Tax=Planoprotostelium fungivorum TaxID=1890364 RepID=A0A2P6N8U1_9EUKA|nr:hypothetical protein PROFUN_11930 [Planoprotostelium fungivorum]